MATGDVHGNLERLRVQLLSIQYPHTFDAQGLKQGVPAVILPLIHFALLGYSRHLARFLSANGYELYSKSDLRFMESTLKFLRQEFNYKSALTIAQIFSRGYAERKLLFVCDVIQMCKRKHNELLKLAHEAKFVNKHVGCAPARKEPSDHKILKCEFEESRPISSPYRQGKPWEDTLRRPAVKEKPFSDIGNSSASGSDRNRYELPQLATGFRSNEISKGSNISSRTSTPTLRKAVGDNTSEVACDHMPNTKCPTTSERSCVIRAEESDNEAEEKDHHEQLCQKIMDMADRLDTRFSALEDGITKAKETLQDKLLSLEDRVSVLETAISNQESSHCSISRKDGQENELDRAGAGTQSHRSALNHEEPALGYDARNAAREQQRQRYGHTPACISFPDIAQNSAQFSNPLSSIFRDAHPIGDPFASIATGQNGFQDDARGFQAIRDISNTHQYVERAPSQIKAAPGLDHTIYEKLRPSINEKKSSNTQEFIASIKARFNRTLEILSQDGHKHSSCA